MDSLWKLVRPKMLWQMGEVDCTAKRRMMYHPYFQVIGSQETSECQDEVLILNGVLDCTAKGRNPHPHWRVSTPIIEDKLIRRPGNNAILFWI